MGIKRYFLDNVEIRTAPGHVFICGGCGDDKIELVMPDHAAEWVSWVLQHATAPHRQQARRDEAGCELNRMKARFIQQIQDDIKTEEENNGAD